MTDNYLQIYKHYEECLDKYGDCYKGVDWPNKQDTEKRHNIMLNILNTIKIDNPLPSMLDFGCGCGHLYEYILSHNLNIDYYGLDISQKFVNICKAKFNHDKFYNIDVLKETTDQIPVVDFIIFNGVFTEKRHMTEGEMWSFFTNVLKKMWACTKHGFAFNVMCPIVDYKNEILFYPSFDDIGLFLKENLSRFYTINNQYGLWEYTVYVYKEPTL